MDSRAASGSRVADARAAGCSRAAGGGLRRARRARPTRAVDDGAEEDYFTRRRSKPLAAQSPDAIEKVAQKQKRAHGFRESVSDFVDPFLSYQEFGQKSKWHFPRPIPCTESCRKE